MIDIINKTSVRINRKDLVKQLDMLFNSFGVDPDDMIEVILVGTRAMRDLNKEHRLVDEATDVLSFPIITPANITPKSIGTLVLCPSVIKKQEGRYEFLRYVVHGFVHLMGYDHRTDDEEQEWNKLIKKINNQIVNV